MTLTDPSSRVLVSAGSEKQALAAVRSLGRAGITVDVTDSKPNAPAFRSRYCHQGVLTPSNRDEKAYVDFLLDRVERVGYTTILPCDDMTARYLSERREAFERRTRLTLPDRNSFRIATNKSALVRHAEEIGIAVPRTRYPNNHADARQMATELGLPLILKGSHGWGAQHVRLVEHTDEIEASIDRIAALEAGRLPMMQEFVPGIGYGLSVLFRHGEARALFMHRRTAEFDVQSRGEPYSCPMAVSVDEPELRERGLTLFEALGWHGLGMAEWRRDARDGRFVLMEINPRLVGSTDLAIRCGVDLPRLAVQMVQEGDVAPVLEHPIGVQLRWLIPDGLRDLLARPRQALRHHAGRTGSDWCWRDLAPHWAQIRRAAWELRQLRHTS